MPEWLYLVGLWFNAVTGAGIAALGFLKRKPQDFMALMVGITELLMLVQLVVSAILVAQGQHAAGDTVEFFIYIGTALLIPVGAVFWAILDRNSHWSTVVLGVAGLSLAVMLLRMHQIWTGA